MFNLTSYGTLIYEDKLLFPIIKIIISTPINILELIKASSNTIRMCMYQGAEKEAEAPYHLWNNTVYMCALSSFTSNT